jgi:FtsP/CotA-like multicopper oxidase with cupredoxin domain
VPNGLQSPRRWVAGRRVVVAFDANNPGLWALHCHLLYHLEAGMFTTLRYV